MRVYGTALCEGSGVRGWGQGSGFLELCRGLCVSGSGFWISGIEFRISWFWVSGFGSRVFGLMFPVSEFVFRVLGTGLRVAGFVTYVSCFMSRVSGLCFGFRGLGFGFWGFGYRIPVFGFGFRGFWSRVQDLDFRIYVSGFGVTLPAGSAGPSWSLFLGARFHFRSYICFQGLGLRFRFWVLHFRSQG